jgi:hypothetical protein
MNRRGKPKQKPSREQVKAWLATVVAPMVDALRVESDRVSRENWSFRCTTRDFESLWPTEKMLSPVYLPNVEQFWRYYPVLQQKAKAHDDAFAELRNPCRDAFERTLRSEDFVRLAEQVQVEKGNWKYLAEYMVNGIRDLPSHYTTSDVWRQHGGAFLDLRSMPALEESFQAIHRTGEAFRSKVERLLQETERLQQALADEFQLPPIDPADAGAV